jgi:uncharacterized protein
MNPERLFVFDNNVLISAFLFRHSTPRKAFDLALSIGKIIRSEESLDELWQVLVRPKFDRYLTLADRISLLKGFEQISTFIPVTSFLTLCRDPKDDKFLCLALDAQAECLLSGDSDLLVLSDMFQIPIITPARFVELNADEP